jgi:acetyl esterase
MTSPQQPWIDQVIDIGQDEPVPVRVYGNRSASTQTPLVVHLHGGAFTSGTLECGSTIARLLARSGAVVLSLDYPLAPKRPFPQAGEAIHAALLWAHRHRVKLAGNGARLFVAGEEAGGNLAAAAALMSRDRQQPPLAGQILLSPMLDPCLGTQSARQADAGRADCKFAQGWRRYLCGAANADHPYAAPGSSVRLAGLPPTLLVTAHDDPMRDETQSFARRLRDARVAVHEVVIPGATGWPTTFLEPASVDSPWAAELHEPFSQFFKSIE